MTSTMAVSSCRSWSLFLILISNLTITTDAISILKFNSLIQQTDDFSVPPGSTLLAPSDSAWDSVSSQFLTMTNLHDDENWKYHAKFLLNNHVIAGQQVPSRDFETAQVTKTTVSNSTVTFYNGTVNANVRIISTTPDMDASTDGILIHELSSVLIPPSLRLNVYQALQIDPDYSTLVRLIDLAALQDFIATQGPLTMLAPTDAAFEKADSDFLDILQKGHSVYLRVFLVHHILDGNIVEWDREGVISSVLPSSLFAYPIEDDPNSIGVNDGRILPESQRVLCENGVLYPVSAVLIPPSVSNMLQNIHLLTEGEIRLDRMATALKNASFLDDLDLSHDNLDGPTQLTMLSPTNGALDAATAIQKYFRPGWVAHLQSLVRHHIIRGKFSLAELAARGKHKTLSNYEITVTSTAEDEDGDAVVQVNDATVSFDDIYVYNSTIQVLDGVLIPPTLQLSIMQQLRRIPDDFSLLTSLLEKVLMDNELNVGEGPYTLFAPTNEALANFDMSSSPLAIKHFIQYHILPMNFVTKTAVTGQLATLLEIPLDVEVVNATTTAKQGDIRVNGIVLQKDLDNRLASNGMIHILSDAILEIPAGYTKEPSAAPSDTPETLAPSTAAVVVPDSSLVNDVQNPAPSGEDTLNAGLDFRPDLKQPTASTGLLNTEASASATIQCNNRIFQWTVAAAIASAAALI